MFLNCRTAVLKVRDPLKEITDFQLGIKKTVEHYFLTNKSCTQCFNMQSMNIIAQTLKCSHSPLCYSVSPRGDELRTQDWGVSLYCLCYALA